VLSIGDQFGRYLVEAKLGEGGMGLVYRATDTGLGRPVAVKIIRPELSGNPEWRKRFAHEARAAARLDHPNIVSVHEVGCEHDLDYICMEYLEGETLDQVLRRRPLGAREALGYAISMVSAMSAAHGAGIVHRDLKPANVFITAGGPLKLLDFGLAKFAPAAGAGESAETRTLTTREGQILGTVSYMSPEQAEGRTVDARSDIFSFGTVLYEMVTGQRAFDRDSNLATLAAILRETPKPVRHHVPSVSPEMDRLIAKCLEKQAGRRFGSMKELQAALEARLRAEQGRRLPWRLRKWTAWARLAAALLCGLALMWWLSARVKLSDMYLFCFILSFIYSMVGAFSGFLHLHHTHFHGPHDLGSGDLPQADTGSAGPAPISPVNAGTIAAFLVWFGGAGYVLAGPLRLGLAPSYPGAVASGCAGAALVFLLLTRVLMAHDRALDPADYEMTGVTGTLSSGIREGGTGEMIFSQAGARRAMAARAVDGAPIPRGARVMVVRHEKGIAYVRNLSAQ